MKKIYLLSAALLCAQLSFSQSTRLVLVEEFTGETCPPCAASNPGFNAILNANAGTVISLKYQNNIPSTGPNFYLYNTTDIGTRTTYYGNTYSPHAFLDGNVWNGNAASMSSAQIVNRGNIGSSFDIAVEQTFSPAHDIVYVHAVIRATQPVNGTTLKARIAIAERDVYGYTSPNGEDVYQHVMRKLLPNGAGTALPASWAAGDSVVIDESWTITVSTNPAIFTPAWARLESIVWVQEDANKEILQTGHVTGPSIPMDPAVTSMSGVVPITCAGSATPTITVTNWEPTTVTSMDIEYYSDSQTPAVYNWTGSLAQGGNATVNLPAVNFSGQGVHTVNARITNANGSPDVVDVNNLISSYSGAPLASATSWTETFGTSPSNAPDWIILNPDNAASWSYVATGAPGSAGSTKVNFYESPSGQVDQLFTVKSADFTTATSPTLTFKMAHQRYDLVYSDRLDVMVSIDCGQTWTSVWNKTDAAGTLYTVTTVNTAAYNTPIATHWRLETVDLTAYAGVNDVLIAFKATSGYGNNLHLDEINVTPTVVGIDETPAAAEKLNVYSTPSTGTVTVSLDNIAADKMFVSVTGISGAVVKEINVDIKGSTVDLDLTDLESGTYFASFTCGNESFLRKIVIQK